MKDYDDAIMYEISLSPIFSANIEVLNAKGININYHPNYWFNIFLPIKSKIRAHQEDVIVPQITSCTHKKEILMNEGEGGKIYLNLTLFELYEVMK